MDPRKFTPVILVMGLVGFVLIMYAFAVGPLASIPPAGAQLPIKTWATTNQTLYGLGDPVNVTVHVENVGAARANFSITSCTAFAFRVLDLQGTPYYDSRNGSTVCITMIREISLAPGQEANQTFRWDQTTSTGLPLPRARWYHIVPVVEFPKASVIEADAPLVFLA